MKTSLAAFTAAPNATILEALERIDANKKGFLVVTDPQGVAIGTLTDGDIRRGFLRGLSVKDGITEVYRRQFQRLTHHDDVMAAVELFKDASIKFLPIVDDAGVLVNIITKNQMHLLLLLDIQADLNHDFLSMDESILDQDARRRPWGFYKTTVCNDYFQSKVISVRPLEQLSLQSHDRREEHWIVAHGVGTVQIGDRVTAVQRGSAVHIPKGVKHRLTNTDPRSSLIVVEVQIGDYFGEDDIVRYEDTYGRV